MACALAFLWLSASALAQEDEESPSPAQRASSDPPISHREQRERYLWSTFGPPGLIGGALAGGFQQWREDPREWGNGKAGYAKRFAAEYAESAIDDTTKYLIARLLDEDPSFRPCDCTGLLPRLRHASLAPFTARKPDGRTVFSLARTAGMTAGNVVAVSTWYPTPEGARDAAKYVAADLAARIGLDLLREFAVHRRPGR